MPHANPIISGPAFAPNIAPAQPGNGPGGLAVNPLAGSGYNAAGTDEPVNQHVAIVVAFALLGVFVLRTTGFKFVVAAGVG